MNSMVLISEELRGDLLGRRVSGGGDREVRVSSGPVGFGGAGDEVGGVRSSVGPSEVKAVSRREVERDSVELEVSDASDDWRNWMHGFEIGDMVWGKVKSHPWWPGHIFSEVFASVSVRRTKREGHVLVAFFGDSSYGWFEPAELVPFDSHFAEKSKQTNSRNFLKAVEEAVDEVNRRRALGLSCRCRNPTSFRPTSVVGHVAVDVIGYEPNLVFSMKEVKKARDAFVPPEVVSSLAQLAIAPGEVEYGTIRLIKTLATLLALRRATYEEFDETYAQAFGVEPVRPARDAQGVNDQAAYIAPRAAPLSGPLVVAEALRKRRSGGGGGAAKPSVVKASSGEQSRKNKYLFKRRDDAPPPKQLRPTAPTPADASLREEEEEEEQEEGVRYIDFSHGDDEPSRQQQVDDFVLQKRAPPEPDSTREDVGSVSAPGPVGDAVGAKVEPDPEVVVGIAKGEEDAKKIEKGVEVDLVVEAKIETDSSTVSVEKGIGDEEKLLSQIPVVAAPVEPLQFEVKIARPPVQKEKASPPRSDGGAVLPSHVDGLGEKKKRRRKIDGEGGIASEQPVPKQVKVSADQDARRKVSKPSAAVAAVSAQDMQPADRAAGFFSPISLPKIELTAQDVNFPLLITDLSALALDPYYGMERNASLLVRHVFLRFRSLVYQKSLVTMPIGESEVETRTGKGEISGAPVSTPADAPSVPSFQTSPPVPTPPETQEPQESVLLPKPPKQLQMEIQEQQEPVLLSKQAKQLQVESRDQQEPACLPKPPKQLQVETREQQEPVLLSKPSKQPQTETREQQEPMLHSKPSKQPQKAVPGHVDQAKSSRKRPPSDRQEEIMVKRENKLKQLKVLASEKKAAVGQKVPMDVQKPVAKLDVQKESDSKIASAAKKIPKPERKPEPAQPKVPSPTYLVMKFPPGTTLPSIASQKVKFGRFGPLDVSGFRVYWKSHTCKMLFKYRADAQNAYMYAVNNDMFGQIKVNYNIRDVEVPTSEPVGADKQSAEVRPDDVQSRPSRLDEPTTDPRSSALRHVQQQQGAQLKSCLKKPPGDEAGPSGSASVKETPRVKFALTVDTPAVAGNGGSGDGRREAPAAAGSGSNANGGRREPSAVGGNGDRRREHPAVAGSGGNGDGRHDPITMTVNGGDGNALPTPIGPPETNYNTSRFVAPMPSSLLAPSFPRPSHLLTSSFPVPRPPHRLARPQIPSPLLQYPPPPPPPHQPAAASRERAMPQLARAQAYHGHLPVPENRNIDISNQMLNLLLRCSEVVKNVNSVLGYAIYHPL